MGDSRRDPMGSSYKGSPLEVRDEVVEMHPGKRSLGIVKGELMLGMGPKGD